MGRERYRETVTILRRIDNGASGGGIAETYAALCNTSAEVRDEKYDIALADQGAPLTEMKIFSFRPRQILPDDRLLWRGEQYEITYIDEFNHRGREMRVRGRRRRDHWSLKGENS